MSTPSVTILKNLVLNWKSNQMEEETIATFYRHWDGYPSCHAIDIANSLIVASRTKPKHIDFSGGCPFSLAFWEPPCGRREDAGSLRERGLGGGFPTLPTACGSG